MMTPGKLWALILSVHAAGLAHAEPIPVTSTAIAPSVADTLQHSEIMVGSQAWMKGYQASATLAESWEASLRQDPDQPELRAMLIAYYGNRRFADATVRPVRHAHILWMIRHHPDSPYAGMYAHLETLSGLDGATAYAEARTAWLEQARRPPVHVQVLANAAAFLMYEDQAESERLLQQAEDLEPRRPEWKRRLGNLYLLESIRKSPSAKKAVAMKALAALEAAKASSTGLSVPGPDAQGLVRAAFMAGEPGKARAYALEWMRQTGTFSWDSGNAAHFGHTALGLLALQEHDVHEAERQLAWSVSVAGSPQLGSFGPSMDLAAALLARGRRDAVSEYLVSCDRFWALGKQTLAEWREELKAGKQPDFSGHLHF